MKKKINKIGIGSFRPGSDVSGFHKPAVGHGSPRSDADSHFSRMSQGIVPNDEELEDDEEPVEVLECRVYRNGKYQLVETLNNIAEQSLQMPDYTSDFETMLNKINNASKDNVQKSKKLDSLEDIVGEIASDEGEELDEFSGGGVAGVMVPMGYTSRGKPETPSERRKRYRFNITRSYPYSKMSKSKSKTKRKRRKK